MLLIVKYSDEYVEDVIPFYILSCMFENKINKINKNLKYIPVMLKTWEKN